METKQRPNRTFFYIKVAQLLIIFLGGSLIGLILLSLIHLNL